MKTRLRAVVAVLGPLVVVLAAAAADRPRLRYAPAPRLIAIGDLHGDIDATRRALRLGGAIDESDRWVGGNLVVVQTGDQLDRGDDDIAVLDLLDRLEHAAPASGGAVHALNGNHEFMNVQGRMRYVTPEGFAAFLRLPGLEALRPQRAHGDSNEWARRAAFAPGGPFALRLARRNVVTIVGDTVFVHGGVLPVVAIYGLDRLNEESRQWLRGELAVPPGILLARWGPVWTRRYSDRPTHADCAMLARTLGMIGAKRMVIGHTEQKDGPRSYCDGQVWCIDVGLSAHYGGSTAVLEIAGDDVRPLVADERSRAAVR